MRPPKLVLRPVVILRNVSLYPEDVAQPGQSGFMAARAHLSNVVQFSLDGRPFAQVVEWQLFPVRFALLNGQQEPALTFRESSHRPLE